jgi:ferric-dicitrate binding protein FerR (iron transport regulator)
MSHAELLILLQRQWTGEIAPEELERLEACLRESPQWAAEAEAYRQIWQRAAPPAGAIEVDLDREFEQLMARIEAADREAAVASQRLRRRLVWWKVAAAAAVAMVAGAVLWFSSPSEPELYEAYAATGHREVRLSDGSLVHLRQGSKLRYDINTYHQRERRVQLEGEAVFTVTHDPQKPFLVETFAGAIAEVIGTQFDLRMENEHTSVLVCDGLVRFWPQGKGPGKKNILLQAQEKARWNNRSRTLEIAPVPNLNELVWQTHRLSFDNEPLANVISALAAYYHVDIQIASAEMRTCAHGGNFVLNEARVDKPLEILCNTYGFRLDKKDDTHYALVGGKCTR